MIEHVHAHVRTVLDFSDARLTAGDYLLVEDSLANWPGVVLADGQVIG